LATAHQPLTDAEALGFSLLIFATAAVFAVWLFVTKTRELYTETMRNRRREQRRKRLVEMRYEQVALEAVRV
jgi:hypothetical protein